MVWYFGVWSIRSVVVLPHTRATGDWRQEGQESAHRDRAITGGQVQPTSTTEDSNIRRSRKKEDGLERCPTEE